MLSRLIRSAAARCRLLLGAAAVAAAVVAAVDSRLVYLLGSPGFAYVALSPQTVPLGLERRDSPLGGLIAADLVGDPQPELIVTTPQTIAAYSAQGERLWLTRVEVRLTAQAETEGLPGLHGPGVQVADADGDDAAEVLLLDARGELVALDGADGSVKARIELPPPPPAAERWEHLVVADLSGNGDRNLVLQATNREGYRYGRFLAAYRIADLLASGLASRALWRRDDFLATAHHGARAADLDGDGRDEILGGEVVSPDGRRLHRLPTPEASASWHLDALTIADVRPDLPGLEVVALEERKGRVAGGPAPQRVFLYNTERVIWSSRLDPREPQNAAVGDFDPARRGLEIWLRSRNDRHQRPWVLSAEGEILADYRLRDMAPLGWSVGGLEEIVALRWSGGETHLIAAKERHESGDVALLDAMTGRFVLRLPETADRLYVADIHGDWREELIVLRGDQLCFYTPPGPNPDPSRSRLWREEHYRRGKQNWSYYSP